MADPATVRAALDALRAQRDAQAAASTARASAAVLAMLRPTLDELRGALLVLAQRVDMIELRAAAEPPRLAADERDPAATRGDA